MSKNGLIVKIDHAAAQRAEIDKLKIRIQIIQAAMRDVMKEGTHFGVIPGTPKKSLWKPGAEIICALFRLHPRYHPTTLDLGNGHREISVRCELFDGAGNFTGEGLGSCSTLETKYRWRKGEATPTDTPMPENYWKLAKSQKKSEVDEAQRLIGGKGFCVKKIDGAWLVCKFAGDKMENSDIADQYNTVLKMAKKRAYNDATITATACSDIFSQDIDEDFEPTVYEPAPEPEAETGSVFFYDLKKLPEDKQDMARMVAVTSGAREENGVYVSGHRIAKLDNARV